MKDPTADSAVLANVTLAMIAGGMGTRMGKPKAWLQIGPQSVLAWMLDRLQWPGPTMLVTAPAVPPPPGAHRFGAHIIDPVDGLGPLRGVLTALQHSSTPVVVTIAVDMPLIRQNHLAWLTDMLRRRPACLGIMGQTDVNGELQIEPFPAVYRIDAAIFLSRQLESGQRSLHRLCRDPQFVALPVPADWRSEMGTNLNDPVQFVAFQNGMAKQSREISV